MNKYLQNPVNDRKKVIRTKGSKYEQVAKQQNMCKSNLNELKLKGY